MFVVRSITLAHAPNVQIHGTTIRTGKYKPSKHNMLIENSGDIEIDGIWVRWAKQRRHGGLPESMDRTFIRFWCRGIPCTMVQASVLYEVIGTFWEIDNYNARGKVSV